MLAPEFMRVRLGVRFSPFYSVLVRFGLVIRRLRRILVGGLMD
jgi:hypothetical protein